jgi:hypothetical protein
MKESGVGRAEGVKGTQGDKLGDGGYKTRMYHSDVKYGTSAGHYWVAKISQEPCEDGIVIEGRVGHPESVRNDVDGAVPFA